MKSSSEVDQILLKIMNDAISDVFEFTKGLSQAQFVKDKKAVAASAMMLQTLGENASKLSLEFQSQLDVNISELTGLRNRISHDYGSLDYDLVWEIVENDLLKLKNKINSLIK